LREGRGDACEASGVAATERVRRRTTEGRRWTVSTVTSPSGDRPDGGPLGSGGGVQQVGGGEADATFSHQQLVPSGGRLLAGEPPILVLYLLSLTARVLVAHAQI
jgi:hypothetical protein